MTPRAGAVYIIYIKGLVFYRTACYNVTIKQKERDQNMRKYTKCYTTQGHRVIMPGRQNGSDKHITSPLVKTALKIALIVAFIAAVLFVGYIDALDAQIMHING